MRARRFAIVAAVFAFALAACSKQSSPPPSAPAQNAPKASDAQAAKDVEMYRQLLQSKSYELAGPIGQEIVAKYPDSAAAKEVRETLADTVAKATAITSRRRLERLWSYQAGKESGGNQTTASIYSSQPNGANVRLILRRHTAWGQSVYLFGSGKGFDCGKACTLSMRFDDAPPERVKAHLPETGEPAIFINDDRGFIAKLSKAQKISIDVTTKSKGAQTLMFEVGGYDPEKFGVPKKG